MGLPTLADPSDLETWLGVTFSTPELVRADLVLDKASALVRFEAQATWVDEDGALSEVPDQIPGIVLEVAARVWDNPTFKSQSAGGPFSDSWGAEVGLFLTDAQKALLPPDPAGSPFQGIGVLSTTRGPIETGSVRDCDDWPLVWE